MATVPIITDNPTQSLGINTEDLTTFKKVSTATSIAVAVTELPSKMTPTSPLSPSAARDEEESRAAKQGNDAGAETDSSEEFSPLKLAEDLAPLPVYKDAGTTVTDLGGLLKDNPLRLREDLADGCGGILWQAGLVLASYMLRYHAKGELAGKRMLELGAGGGLVGLAVAKGCELGGEGHPPLLITDQQEMFSLMKHNIALNELEKKVEAELLNWGEPLPDSVWSNPPDVVLAADCVYFEPAFPLLLATLTDLVSVNEAVVVYFCFKKRRRADMHFLKQLRKKFSVAEVEDSERPVWSRQGLFLFAVTAKGR
ncbi:putative methyltransferase-domain-containing protein [Xylariaceae sp. FL0255]|nr:putative methyltransferase-domain-containing protein [Xylariaceae sp. FL0255]